jgi:spermidine synthase
MKPWVTLETVATREGALQLRQRDRDFIIAIDGRVLMTSTDRRSEEALATVGCAAIANRTAPRVMIGGLGMAYTLRAALDSLPDDASVTVVELSPEVERWCRGPLAPLTNNAVGDPRVRVVIDDVSRAIANAPRGAYDAILLDLYEGPNAASQRGDDPFYGPGALARGHAALVDRGILGIWAEDPDAAFERRVRAAGFALDVQRHGKIRHHVVYLARRLAR